MKTYKYRFPAEGYIGGPSAVEGYTEKLRQNLDESPDCLGAWCMFPTDSATLEGVNIETDGRGNATGIVVSTYTQLWEGREDDFKSCLEENLKTTFETQLGHDPASLTVGDVIDLGADEGRQTYGYRFPASGVVENADQAELLSGLLDSSPSCLGAYAMFPSDSAVLESVDFEMEGSEYPKRLKAVNMHTFVPAYDGSENDLMDCMAENLGEILPNARLTEPVQAVGKEGGVPETLYHITEKASLDSIMKDGLVPSNGNNAYKDHDDHVYLASANDLAPWMAVLPNMEDPVILKVDAKGLTDIEQGRVFNDREYVDGVYSEYRTAEKISADRLSMLSPENEADKAVCEDMCAKMMQQMTRNNQIEDTTMSASFTADEPFIGAKRLHDMGYLDDERYSVVTECLSQMDGYDMPPGVEKLVTEMRENGELADNGPVELPWDEPENEAKAEEDDDFTKAVEQLSGQQMSLSDFGVNM